MKYSVLKNVVMLSIGSAMIAACSTTATYDRAPTESASEHQPASVKTPQPATAPLKNTPSMEGGIVGTGNEDDCKNSENKEACNDNVQ